MCAASALCSVAKNTRIDRRFIILRFLRATRASSGGREEQAVDTSLPGHCVCRGSLWHWNNDGNKRKGKREMTKETTVTKVGIDKKKKYKRNNKKKEQLEKIGMKKI